MIYILILIVIIELLYSLYKKDGIYSLDEALANIAIAVIALTIIHYIPFMDFTNKANIFSPHIPHIFNIQENILTFILCVLAVDLSYYIFHRINHATRFWLFHSVHHNDTKLNLSVSLRASWFELIYFFFFFTPVLFLGFSLKQFLLAASVLIWWAPLTHSQYFKLPRFLEIILVTPRYHKIHHDNREKNQNSNFGGIFTMWDKIFGTYTKEVDNFNFGVKDYSQTNFIKIQIDPLIKLLKKILHFA